MARWAGTLAVGALLLVGGAAVVSAQEVTVTARVALVERARGLRPDDNSNVVVWLAPLGSAAADAARASLKPTRERLRLIQKRKRFDPHVMVVTEGSVVEFPNRDPFFHNVFSLFEGKRFDLGLYEAGTTRDVHFDRPGICYIFCNIHSEMSAVVVVLKTPYFGISDRNGDLTIPDVPPGRYQVEVWHERSLPEVLKAANHEVTIGADARFLGNIRLSEATDLRIAHRNKYGREYDPATPSNPLYEQP